MFITIRSKYVYLSKLTVTVPPIPEIDENVEETIEENNQEINEYPEPQNVVSDDVLQTDMGLFTNYVILKILIFFFKI